MWLGATVVRFINLLTSAVRLTAAKRLKVETIALVISDIYFTSITVYIC